MGNGILAFYLFEAAEVEGIGFALALQNQVVDLAGKLSTDDIGKNFPLGLELGLNRDGIQNLLVESVDLADLQCEGIGNLLFLSFDEFVDNSCHVLVVSLYVQQLEEVEVIRWFLDLIGQKVHELGIFYATMFNILLLKVESRPKR